MEPSPAWIGAARKKSAIRHDTSPPGFSKSRAAPTAPHGPGATARARVHDRDSDPQTRSVPMAELLPALFFGHGNPMNALLSNSYTAGWQRIGQEVGKPRAVLSIS